jgi:hypothetical protein
MYVYSDPTREPDPWSLPNVEILHVTEGELSDPETGDPLPGGWFFAFGFPGCLWDSDPFGPYETEEEAIAAAREVSGD